MPLFIDSPDIVISLFPGFIQHFYDELSQKSNGEKVDSRNDKKDRRDEHRAVLLHDGYAKEQLFNKDIDKEDETHRGEEKPHRPEGFERILEVVQDEFEPKEVKEDSIGSAQAVFRLAVGTLVISHDDFGNPHPHLPGDGGDKAMELPVEANALDDVAAIRLKRRAEIMDIYSGNPGKEPVGDHGGNTPDE